MRKNLMRTHCGMLLFWLILCTARANDITSTCAAAFRLTLKGYVSNGKDLAKVCSPPPATCRRPAGIYHMYCKQCAGYVMGKNVFNPLWPTGNITWIESTTLGHGKTARLLASAQRSRWVTITVLRHPIDRIVAHYFATQMNTDLDAWSTKALAKQRRGYDGSTRLWLELENLYVKLFSAHDDRRGPLPPDALERADRQLQGFDRVVIAEWLESPRTIAWLGDIMCFAHVAGVVSGKWPSFVRTRRRRGGKKVFEEFRRDSYESAEFWRAARPRLEDLERRNSLDQELYARAARRMDAESADHWRRTQSTPLPALAPLPCAGGHCWDLARGGPPRDAALAVNG